MHFNFGLFSVFSRNLSVVAALSVFMWTLSSFEATARAGHKPACVAPGFWQAPGGGSGLRETDLLNDMAKRPVVMLGESHISAEHHRWQLHVLSALHGRNPNMVLGFESFPRTVQPVLDRWIRGELSEKEFLKQSRWDDVWRFDPKLYMPLFHFARMHRIPMRALNVERELVNRVSDNGWDSIPADDRLGITDPRPPSAAYRKTLEDVFAQHLDDDEQDKKALTEDEKKRLKGFIEVQLLWDRAMAQAIADVSTAGGDPLVVAIIGRGHLEYGYGVPHQLADLGIQKSAVLLPWDTGLPCDELQTDEGTPVAEAVFGVDAPKEPKKPYRPLLGVRIENGEAGDTKGVRIAKVLEGSVAEASGLQKDDLIISAADRPTKETPELVATIRRQAPGTWLPMVILRDGERQEIIAKFPAKPENHKHP